MMQRFSLWDADCGCSGIAPGEKDPVTADTLEQAMERLEIDRALVQYAPLDLSQAFDRRNDVLFTLAETHPRLHPCPAVTPAMALDEAPETDQVSDLIRRGARAVTLAPAHDHWLVEPFVCDRLFEALQEVRMPVIAPAAALPLEKTAELAGRFPKLPFVITGLGYRVLRNVLPLLDTFPNVCISVGDNFSIQGIIERLVARYGAARLVFGTGFPKVDPAGAVTQLAYARISDDDKQMIGRGSLVRLFNEVKA